MKQVDSQLNLLRVIESMPGARVLVVGDLMLDVYWNGEVSRISPEAPVPVVDLRKRTARLGGAGNVAVNIAALGGQAHLIACLGRDAEGAECAGLLAEAGLASNIVWCEDRQTSVKTRVMAQSQQIIRLDNEAKTCPAPDASAQLLKYVEARADEFSHVVLSDYNKGVVTQNLIASLTAKGKKVIIDPKPQHAAWYKNVFLMTPNAQETKALLADPTVEDPVRAAVVLRQELGLDYLLATLGPDGMALVDEQKVVQISSLAQQVFDVTGAGDTVIAVLSLALAAGNDILESCIVANYAAGIAVEKVGAAQVSIPEILRSFRLYEPKVQEHYFGAV